MSKRFFKDVGSEEFYFLFKRAPVECSDEGKGQKVRIGSEIFFKKSPK